MQERKRAGNEIGYLLDEGMKGNARCAYLAGLKMEEEGYRPFFVQRQFRHAAELGFPPAQRWLGILGLCHQLQTRDCSYSETVYYEDYEAAIYWLRKAACGKDRLAAAILAGCGRLGIGMEADESRGKNAACKERVALSEEEAMAVSFLFRIITRENDRQMRDICRILRNTPLCRLAG